MHLCQNHRRSRWWHHLCLFVFIKQANGPSQRRPPPPPGCRTTIDAAVGLIQVVLAPKHLSSSPSRTLRPLFIQEFHVFLFSVEHNNSLYLYAHQDDVRIAHFSMAMTMSTLTSATLALRGSHLHVVFIDFYSSHNIRAIMTLQLPGVSSSDSTFDLFSNLTICCAPIVTGGC
jgi:hypothetical protein